MKADNQKATKRTGGALALTLGLALIIPLQASSPTMSSKKTTDEDGHVLVSLWKSFEQARAKDRPLQMEELLTQIKAEATERRLPWDFWDASYRYVNVATSRNWKVSDSVRVAQKKEIEAFDFPIVTFCYYLNNSASSYLLQTWLPQNAERMRSEHNTVFYDNVGGVSSILDGAIVPTISNDYEFALWALWNKSPRTVGALVKKELDGRYPGSAYIDYWNAADKGAYNNDYGPRKKAFEEVVANYGGTAVGHMARCGLVRIMKSEEDIKPKSPSEAYKQIRQRAKDLEKVRTSMKGSERRIADVASLEDFIETLDSKHVWVEVEDTEAVVTMRNLSSVQFNVYDTDGKTRYYRTNVSNPVKSYYATDTVRVPLPKLDDGDYAAVVRSGRKVEAEQGFSRHTLSMAVRPSSEGYGVYVTAFDTGEPIKEADLYLRLKGDVLCKCQGVPLKEGFTTLPSVMQAEIDAHERYSYMSLEATYKGPDGRLRRSKSSTVHRGGSDFSPYDHIYTDKEILVFTDRGAYNPGETLFYKALVTTIGMDGPDKILSKVEEGMPLAVDFYDSENNKIASAEAVTGPFGSISGSFEIPVGLRGGVFRLKVADKESKGYSVSTSVRVDEFVLPTFDIQFTPSKDVYTPGDLVTIEGKVVSYSGHSLDGAEATYTAGESSGPKLREDLKLEPDGSFKIQYQSSTSNSGYGSIRFAVKVVDNTGETQERTTYVILVPDLNLGIKVVNSADASIRMEGEPSVPVLRRKRYHADNDFLLYEDKAVAEFRVTNPSGQNVPMPVHWILTDAQDKTLREGTASSGEPVAIDMTDLPGALYLLKADATLKKDKKELFDDNFVRIIKVRDGDTALCAPVVHLLRSGKTELSEGQDIVMTVGSATAPLWAVAELFGEGGKLLESRLVYLSGKKGEDGSLADVRLPYKESYPPTVRMHMLFFRDSGVNTIERMFMRKVEKQALPLSFTSFQDKTKPRTDYSFKIATAPDTEILASIYDKSVDRIAGNDWSGIYVPSLTVPAISLSTACGSIDNRYYSAVLYSKSSNAAAGKGVRYSMRADAMDDEMMLMRAPAEQASMELDVEESTTGPVAAPAAEADVAIRENFAKTLAFLPHLLSNAAGEVTLDFSTADKLSTYVVALYAHNKQLSTATLRQETIVTIPVKVAVMEPGVLYCGDVFQLSASLSSNVDRPVSGVLSLYQYDTADYQEATPVKARSVKVEVPARSTVQKMLDVDVPKTLAKGVEEGVVGFKLVFTSDDNSFSDGLFVSTPLRSDKQVLTEAHSGVLLPGMDKDQLIKKIRGQFVNVSGNGAKYREITVIDMVRDAIPTGVEAAGKDVLSMSEAYYMRTVADALLEGEQLQDLKKTYSEPSDKLMARIFSCRNSDGGFAWFEGMSSSPIITAVVLERFHKLFSLGLVDGDVRSRLASSVRWLDNNRFDYTWPSWCGGLSDSQYMYVRSMYPEVPFEVKGSKLDIFNKRMREFKEYAAEYLTPKEERGLSGQILAKARRLATLQNLDANASGEALAKAWGIKRAGTKISASLEDDILSLVEYAVDHKNGGVYYPNAVMPYRGLLESEAYAHSLICDLFTRYSKDGGASAEKTTAIADGLRVWLMIQKETQQWDAEPAFVDAVASILAGDENVKSTTVILMSQTYEKPFTQIKAAGNGMKISRSFYKDVSTSDEYAIEEIGEGTPLRKGDRITAVYKIWNEENRSFVRLSAPREAALRPVDQLSGIYGWGVRPLSVGGYFTIRPHGYRDVGKARTVYYFDTCPEEHTTVEETFYVTQSGTFHAPVLEIECLYSPHYRANSKYGPTLKVK